MLTEVESLKQSDICCVLLLPLLVVAGCRRRRRRVLRARTCRTVSPHPGRVRTKIEAQRLQNQCPEATKSTPEAPKSTPESQNRHRKFQNRPRRVTRDNNIQKSHYARRLSKNTKMEVPRAPEITTKSLKCAHS